MIEEALQLGPEGNLVAVQTRAAGVSKPIVPLILNAGVIHRIGPHRINVKLARHLAAMGYSSLRFDIAGVGDSRAPRGASDFHTQAVLDICAVMDAVERERGSTSFALVGICSGAVNAYATALADERVAGIFMIDGYVYPTRKTKLNLAAAMVRAYGVHEFTRKLARWIAQGLRSRARGTADAPVDETFSRQPTREQFAREIGQLVDRNVSVTMMHTASILELYSYPAQLHDAFRGQPWLPRVTSHFTLDIDHTVTSLAAQGRFFDLVAQWVEGVAPAVRS
jgi:pimeloyl-ACP methyl ester carboxylesterase